MRPVTTLDTLEVASDSTDLGKPPAIGILCNASKPGFCDSPGLARTGGDDRTRKLKAVSKTRCTYPGCGLHAWGKPIIYLICVDCEEQMAAASRRRSCCLDD